MEEIENLLLKGKFQEIHNQFNEAAKFRVDYSLANKIALGSV